LELKCSIKFSIAFIHKLPINAINKSINNKREAAQEGFQGLASGGSVIQGGFFKLHKDETAFLPAGSAVTPAAGGMGGGNLSTTINLRQLVIQLDRERQRMDN